MTISDAPAKPMEDLARVYSAIAEWLLYPEQIDPESLTDEAVKEALWAARAISPEAEDHLRAFLEERGSIDSEQYVALFELSPRYPLYLGTHQFEEPTTCSQAGMSDRNTYMLEIANIYRHFGVELQTELPDYLPAMTEFLAISAACPPSDDDVRVRLVDKLMIDGVRLLAERLDQGEVPHRRLLAALICCLEVELAPLRELDLVGAAAGGEQLIQIEEVPGRG
jgi:nitrate reductase molybdenum cofactor assembly chaperone